MRSAAELVSVYAWRMFECKKRVGLFLMMHQLRMDGCV